jgi:hypothetical protein
MGRRGNIRPAIVGSDNLIADLFVRSEALVPSLLFSYENCNPSEQNNGVYSSQDDRMLGNIPDNFSQGAILTSQWTFRISNLVCMNSKNCNSNCLVDFKSGFESPSSSFIPFSL